MDVATVFLWRTLQWIKYKIMNDTGKMKVEIWSDVMCPFCYIGKRKFEHALAEFPNAEAIEIEWKSFQLSPDMKTEPGKTIHQFLSEHKGIDPAQAKKMNEQVSNMAKQSGLSYNFDIAVPANSLKAHRFSHLAKQYNVQNKAEEALFKAYFTDGRNIDDIATLCEIGTSLGMDSQEIKNVLEGEQYTDAVHEDIYEAQQIGVRGVPFFVFDRKYAISGAQENQVFANTLNTAFSEWQNAHKTAEMTTTDGATCKPDGTCD